MGWFDWLRKKPEEKSPPCEIIDVTLDELLTYVGKGRYVVLCEHEDKVEVLDHLLKHCLARSADAYLGLLSTHHIVILGSTIGGMRKEGLLHDRDFHAWLRLIGTACADVDDLI